MCVRARVVDVVVNQAEKVLWCYSCTFSRAISLSLPVIETPCSVHSVSIMTQHVYSLPGTNADCF